MNEFKLVPVEPTEQMFFDPDDVAVNLCESPWEAFCRIYANLLATAPESPDVQGELVGWQFYKHGKWWNGDILTKNQRKNIEKEGVRVRNVYAEPQLAEQQPAPDVAGLVEALEDISGTHHHSASAGEYFAKVAREALAAYRKGDAS